MEINVALMQLNDAGNPEGNLEKGIDAIRSLEGKDIDIVLFPEMWSIGYNFEEPEKMHAKALDKDSAFLESFRKLAGQYGVAIGITALENYEGKLKNTLFLYDRHGKLVLQYAKVHTCDFGDECILSPGDDFYVCDLDTSKGMVKVGAMICYDREFPESARILMLKGAEIVLVPNACPMEINRLHQLRGRAFENMMGIATVNYPSPHEDCNGHSSAFDGVAYLPDMDGSRDMCILMAPEEEGIYVASFDIDMMRQYRKDEVHGNAYRRPEKYHPLTDEKIEDPFIREDRRK